ncbi:MAG: serine/threonine protein kinase, partial [Acidobacteria bacterium]|nr:serine/threonine protein kinase [Acidobacteriota bacterium]
MYRAVDTSLDREVALKLLPADFADDPERHARFEREAKVLASLNHPNIATLYELEHLDGRHVLVMELVEGEGLDERIGRGAVPPDEAVPIALQIAEALEAAHERGIVHRDLKPANVRIRADGTVKVLDFGLAKTWTEETTAANIGQSPTITSHHTRAGLILGTAGYMAPEQARGKPVDKRADIWAFGVVLYEMLTGKTLFPGETVSDVLAGVLTREPDWARLPAAAHHAGGLLARCLEKDPRRRIRDIGDVRLELERAWKAGPSAAAATAAERTGAPHSGIRLLGLALAALAGVAIGVVLMRLAAPAPPERGLPLRLSIPLAPTQQIATVDSAILAFSPDGSSLVVPVVEGGRPWLVRRRLDQPFGERIEGTEGGAAPFFSPDGKWLGFIAGGKMMKVPAEGGRPFVLADQQGAGGAAWCADGRIVFAPIYSEGLFRVSVEGGEPERLTSPNRAQGELGHWWPQPLPGGRDLIFTAFRSPVETSRVGVVSLQTGEVRELVDGGFFARYVPSGHLLYVKGDRLLAAPFDPGKAVVTGPAKSVLDDVYVSPTEALSLLDVSTEGTLAWVPGSVAEAARDLLWIERDGRTQPAIPEPRRYRGASVSPDGRSLATAILDDSLDIWAFSLERGTLSRLTTGPRTEFAPFWTPDGASILFVLDRPPFEIHRIAFGGSAEGKPLWTAEHDTVLSDLSPDGRLVAYTLTQIETGADLWVGSVVDGEPGRAFRATRYAEQFGTFSPDGRWLAYQSDETGRPEIYVEAFPGPGARFQVSADGGTEPFWARGSGELFYRHGDEMRVVQARVSPAFELGAVRTLFKLSFHQQGHDERTYRVTPDGQRVLAGRVPDSAAPR